MVETTLDANQKFWAMRAQGYAKLAWANNGELLKQMVNLADLQGHETVVDEGTGSQAVLDAIATRLNKGGCVHGFDISVEMMTRKKPLPDNARLYVASAYDLPFADASTHLVTARMVYHHLEDIGLALAEVQRILRPGGRLIINEYVEGDEEVLRFEQPAFDIKEKGRNMWTGEQLRGVVNRTWNGNTVDVLHGVLPQYSVKDWMGNSGLPESAQQAVLDIYLKASDNIVDKMGITYTEEGDALVDRPFVYIVAEK